MRYDVGRFRRPMRRSTEGQLMSLISLGDGSTLSLDFTTGILDPRLTFTRSTNATFINSSGLVEWANANMYWNTAFEGLSGTNPSLTSSGWGYVFSSGNAVFNGDNTVTMTTTAAQRSVLFRSTGFSGGGLRVVSSVDVTIHSGSLQASQVIVTGTPTNAQHYVNGLIWNNTHPNWNGGILPVGTQFNIAYATDTQTSGTTSMWFGVGCSSAIAGSATFVNPRWTMWKGSATVPYYPNTSATNNPTANYFKSNDYQAPRFDYDPTTLAPRGLLIEGSAVNLALRSNDFNTTVNDGTQWVVGVYTRGDVSTTLPDGTTGNACRISGTGSASFRSASIAVNASTAYTFSFWARNNGGSQARYRVWNGTAGSSIVDYTLPSSNYVSQIGGANNTSTTWVRVSVTFTTPVGCTSIFVYPTSSDSGTVDLLLWGAQVELGSGASSYTPTGASQGTRNSDFCYMSGISSWFNAPTGTIISKVTYSALTGSNAGIELSVGTGSSPTNRIGIRKDYVDYYSGGGAAQAEMYPTVTSGAVQIGTAYAANDFAMCSNGGTMRTDSSGAVPIGLDTLKLYSDGGASSGLFLNGWMRSFKYFPTRLPNAQLQSLTT